MNVASLLDDHPDSDVALISGGRTMTYGELRDEVDRLRAGLAGLGIRSGDRVAVVCANNHYFVSSYLALAGLGATTVPLNPASPGPELTHELAAVDVVAAIVGPAGRTGFEHVDRAAVPSLRHVILAERDPGDAGGDQAFGDLLKADRLAPIDVQPDHLAALLFTSGTSGPPRAAMLSHGNLLANIEQSLSVPNRTRSGDVVYGVLPLFHIFGLNVVLGASFKVGATVLLDQRFDPTTAVELCQHHRVTVIPGAPPMWIALGALEDVPTDAFASVRLALSGASRLAPSVAERFRDRFGIQIHEGYGLTEASPVVTSSAGIEWRPGSVGRTLAGVEVRVVADDGHDAAVGDAGEVWVRGANVFLGYWNDPETTARVVRDGWLRTGDIAVVDDDGYLYLVDRAKDLIIVSGFNVFPAEVEEVLLSHPEVSEVGVVGVPHPHSGEAVKAYVVTTHGSTLDEETLIEHSMDFLARYKCPTKIMFVDQLPRNSTGKLLRRELHGTVLS